MATIVSILTQRSFLLILIFVVVAVIGVGMIYWILPISDGNPLKNAKPSSQNKYITVADLSGNGNHGTLVGEPHPVDGKFGPGLGFDGNDDFISLGDVHGFEDLAPFTISLWAQDSGASGSFDRLVSKESIGDPRDGWLIFRHKQQDKYGLERWEGGVADKVYIPYPTGLWNHVAFAYDGASMRGYLNGVLAAEPVPSSNRVRQVFYPLAVGAGGDGILDSYNGEIDDLRIYGRALSDEEIAKLAQGLEPGPDQSSADNLVGHWTFDELLTGAQ